MLTAIIFDYHYVYILTYADLDRLLNDNEIWRVFSCQLTFTTIGEVIFGLLSMIPLMRRFEREVSVFEMQSLMKPHDDIFLKII